MGDPCREHRPFVSAFADGEIDLVPERSRAHLAECPDCAEEMAAHGLLGEKLRSALGGMQQPAAHRNRRRLHARWARLAAGLAAAAAVVGGSVTGWLMTHSTADALTAAVAVSRQSPTLHSSDAQAIARWCAQRSERPQPIVQLPALVPLGARMDRESGTNIVTVFYSAESGQHLAVAWLDADVAAPTDLHVQSRSVDGQNVLVLRTHDGTAVVSGDAPSTVLWSTAGALEAQSQTG